jgi:hypothetical protein
MFMLKPLAVITFLVMAYAQDPAPRPVVLPDLPPPPAIKPVVQTAPLPPAPQAPPVTSKEAMSVAIYQNTVYFKVGDMIVPMVGTTGCFTPKELLKAGDARLQFNNELPAPPPPPNR